MSSMPDGNTRFGRFAEAKLLELVEHGDGLIVATNFVAFPNEVAEFLLAGVAVEETISSGQISLKKKRPTEV